MTKLHIILIGGGSFLGSVLGTLVYSSIISSNEKIEFYKTSAKLDQRYSEFMQEQERLRQKLTSLEHGKIHE